MKRCMIGMVLVVMAMASIAQAFTYDSSKVMAVTWSNMGRWYACGPVQCTSVSERTEDDAFDLVDGYKKGPWEYIGGVGKCRVYQGSAAPSGGDYDADWVVQKIKKYCY